MADAVSNGLIVGWRSANIKSVSIAGRWDLFNEINSSKYGERGRGSLTTVRYI